MPDDVKQVSSPATALEQAIAASPAAQEQLQEQAQEAQSPPAEQGVAQEQEAQQAEESRVPYSRLKEVVDEKNYFRQLWEQERQKQLAQQQFQQPTQDPYAGLPPEEKVFYQNIDKRIEEKANQIAESKVRNLLPIIDAGRQEIAKMGVKLFRKEYPDIKANSPDEVAIAERIQMGYLPEDAYWAVMGPKGVKVAERQGEQRVKQQIEAKKKANVEASASIPQQAQSQPKKSFRESFWENYQKAEKGEL